MIETTVLLRVRAVLVEYRWCSGSHDADAADVIDLALSLLAEELGLDNDGLLGEDTLAEHLEEALCGRQACSVPRVHAGTASRPPRWVTTRATPTGCTHSPLHATHATAR